VSAQSTPIIGAAPQEPPRSCANCRYWLRREKGKPQGECYFDPPRAVPTAGPPGLDGVAQVGLMQIRPPTSANEFCHEHTGEGEMHASEALVAAVADLIEPVTEMRDYLRQIAAQIGMPTKG
jgi:hypothetical protein